MRVPFVIVHVLVTIHKRKTFIFLAQIHVLVHVHIHIYHLSQVMFSMILEKLFYCTDTGILDLYKYTRISWMAILKMNMIKIRLDVISRRRIHTNYFEWKKARFWLAAKNTISWWIIHAVLIWDRDRVFFFCSVYFMYTEG